MPIDPKKILLGKIEGLKIANESFSNFSFFNSFPSLSTSNSLTFLTDFFKLFFGGQRIKSDLIRFLTTELKSLGEDLLRYFKKTIVEYYSCNIDVVIPDEFFSEFTFTVKEIDFFGILKIDPNSEFGIHYYQNYPNNLDVLLYTCIQNPSVEYNWQSILILKYANNKFYVKLDPSLMGKTIYEFVNLYLGNIQLYDNVTILSDIIDALFGTVTSLLNFSKKDLTNRIEFDILFDRIMESIDIDDGFYTFDTENVNAIVETKKSGYYELVDCETNFVKYDYNLFHNFLTDLQTSQYEEKIYDVNLDFLVNQTSNTVSPSDKGNYKNNILLNFFRQISKSIVFSLFSPKKILFIRIFAKMAAKIDLDVTFVGFFKQHRNFIFDIIKKHVLQAVLKYLLAILIQELSKLIADNNVKKQQEQLKHYILQITSLISI